MILQLDGVRVAKNKKTVPGIAALNATKRHKSHLTTISGTMPAPRDTNAINGNTHNFPLVLQKIHCFFKKWFSMNLLFSNFYQNHFT